MWQKARLLTKGVYVALRECRDGGYKDQIQRASVSVMSNIAEGFERGTKNEFINYLYIAKGSAGEVRAQLYAGLDIGYLNIETFEYLKDLATQCSKLIHSFTEKVKANDKVGMQYKRAAYVDPMEEITKARDYALWERLYKNK